MSTVHVSKPFLPPKESYVKELDSIYSSNWLTNNGPLCQALEASLKNRLNLDHLLFVTNGTIALQLIYKALNLSGNVITTPFSYVATASSIAWQGLKFKFADIEPDSFNIDPVEVEKLIDENTSAIVATHVFGNPCKIEQLKEIAEKYNVKLIFDAAHCFGVKYKERSILEYGNVSAISFHATKIFHTIEGGAIVSTDQQLIDICASMRNFGHAGYDAFSGEGINGKNSEFHAAMGLCNLNYVDQILEKYKELYTYYFRELSELESLNFQKIIPECAYNHAYFPILFSNEEMLIIVKDHLEQNDIWPRRYFYPSLTELPYAGNQSCPVASYISKRILCLPMFYDLSIIKVGKICALIKSVIKDAG